MKKLIFFVSALVAALITITSCGAPSADNGPANKPANTAASTAPVNTAAIEADLKKLVTEYAASMAKNDVAAFEKTTTDNYMFVSNDGALQTRTERVASMKSGETKYESLTYDDLSVRVNAEGDGAVVIGKATVKGMNMGKPIESVNRVTQVWSKTKDGWKMASLQATVMTAKADDKPKMDDKAKVDDKKMDKAPAAPANK